MYGGGGRIRTIEGGAGRFTVCSLWPLGNPSRGFLYLESVFPTRLSKCFLMTRSQETIWWRGTDSNHRRRSRQIYSLLPLATREPLRVFLYLESVFPTRLSKCFLMTRSQETIWWRGTDSNHRRRSRQIYSLLPLATREPLRVFLYLESVFPTRLSKCFLMTRSQEKIWWRGTDSNHRRRSRQIYSLLPLATREPLQGVFLFTN